MRAVFSRGAHCRNQHDFAIREAASYSEQCLCARVLELKLKFRSGIRSIGRRYNTRKSMGCICQCHRINLVGYQCAIPSPIYTANILSHTVLSANMPMTLSHSVPLFGCHPNSFARARARCSTLSTISTAEYVIPEIPHVKGFLESLFGHLPCLSSSINWLIGTESGGPAMLAVSNLLFLAIVRSSTLLIRQNAIFNQHALELLTGEFGNPRWGSEHHFVTTSV